MTCYCLIILVSLIFPFSSMGTAQASSFNDELSLMKIASKNNLQHVDGTVKDMDQHQLHSTSFESSGSGLTADLRPGKGHNLFHHRYHLRNAHGVLNIIGWGTLLPIGAIIARYFRKFPLKSDEWYPLHVLCQTSGYIVGTIGWGIGLWLGNTSKHYTPKAHRILGILVFTLATLQMLTTFLQPRREDEFCKCLEICHHVVGYVVIALSIANIFEGITHQNHAEKWKLIYVGIVAVLACVALALEIFRWIIKSRIQQQIPFENNMYNFS